MLPRSHSFALLCFACNHVRVCVCVCVNSFENETPIIFLRHSLKIHNSLPMVAARLAAAAATVYGTKPAPYPPARKQTDTL